MKALLFACLLVFTATIAKADIPKPKPTPRISLHTSMEIATDPKAYEAKLQITESSLKELRAALDGTPSNGVVVGSVSTSITRTIIAGLLMFTAISIGGLLLVDSTVFGRRKKTAGAALLVVVLIGAAAIITRGNAGPPGSYRWRPLPQNLAEGKPTFGSVDIEIVPDKDSGADIRLVMPLKKQSGNGDE